MKLEAGVSMTNDLMQIEANHKNQEESNSVNVCKTSYDFETQKTLDMSTED